MLCMRAVLKHITFPRLDSLTSSSMSAGLLGAGRDLGNCLGAGLGSGLEADLGEGLRSGLEADLGTGFGSGLETDLSAGFGSGLEAGLRAGLALGGECLLLVVVYSAIWASKTTSPSS